MESVFRESQSRIDRMQIAALWGLMVLGALFVYSATMVTETAVSAPLYKQIWFRQIIWYGIGIVAATGVCLINYHTLARWAMVAYWGAVVLLVVVLFFGTSRAGARRWFDLGFFSLQPSEFAKLAFILAQAHFLSRPTEELQMQSSFWQAIGMMVLPFVLIMKEPDLGSALVLLPTGFAMLFVAGTPRGFLVPLPPCIRILSAPFLLARLFSPPGWGRIKLSDFPRPRVFRYFSPRFFASH